MPDHPTPDVPTADQLANLCDGFRAAYQQGQNPRLEDWLDRIDEGERPRLLSALLKIELDYRQHAGEQPASEDYTARFPALVDEIERVFAERQVAAPAAYDPFGSTGIYEDEDTQAEPVKRPEWIGRYRVEKVLGSGRFGCVYLAYDEKLKRPVAIKVPHPHLVPSSAEAQPYLAEAQKVAGLDHPHLVPVYDVGSSSEFPLYIVSKPVEGENLSQRLERGSLSFEESAQVIADLAEALHVAHQNGLVHRDVKPANVLIDNNGNPLLTDFGLALHEAEQPSRRDEVSGSPAYMAPEQTEGKSHYLDGRTDVWALGVMLYEMLTGRRPFRESTVSELFEEIRHREPKPPRMINPEIPPRLEEITLRCLRKSVAERYRTAADLAEDLRAWQTGADRPRKPWLVAGGALLLVVLGLVGLFGRTWWANEKQLALQPTNHETRSPSIANATAPRRQPLSGSLDVRIWNPEVPGRRGLSLRDGDALPLRNGDQLRIEGQTNQPAYLYLIWVGSDGKAQPLVPWQPGTWKLLREKEEPTQRIASPPVADQGWRLTGGPGMESVFLLGRDKPLSPAVSALLQDTLEQLPAFPAKTPQDLVWLSGQEVIAVAGSRGGLRALELSDSEDIDDPLLKAQALVQEKLKPHFPWIQAVTFASRPEG